MALALLCSSPSVMAQTVSPSDVYQVTDKILYKLARIHQYNLSSPSQPTPHLPARRPGHVLQKSIQIHTRLQLLRRINGLSEMRIPEVPQGVVKPAFVIKILNATYEGISNLSLHFKVPDTAPEPRRFSGKTPTDVYAQLIKIDSSITALGLPSLVPNDVYRMAMRLIDLSENISKKSIPLAKLDAKKKSPSDVFREIDRSYQIISDKCTSKQWQCAKISLIPIPPSSQKITPSVVLEHLINLYAELRDIAAINKIHASNAIPPEQSGKTPSNAFNIMYSLNQALVE